MTPTNELRFVERQIHSDLVGVKRILQQKWVVDPLPNQAHGYDHAIEWRDVPVVKEQANAADK